MNNLFIIDFLFGLSIPVIGKVLFNTTKKTPQLKQEERRPLSNPIKTTGYSSEQLEFNKKLGLRKDLILRKKYVQNNIIGFSPRVEKKVKIPQNISLKSSPEGIIISGDQ